jgi:hypothetical protein
LKGHAVEGLEAHTQLEYAFLQLLIFVFFNVSDLQFDVNEYNPAFWLETGPLPVNIT